MPLVRNEPLEIFAAWLSGWYERLASAGAHHQVRFHRGVAERLQQADPVARALHAGHGDDQPFGRRSGADRRGVLEGSFHQPPPVRARWSDGTTSNRGEPPIARRVRLLWRGA